MQVTAADAMDARVVVAHWHEPAATALARLDDAAAAMLVVDGDRVVAVIERDRLRRRLAAAMLETSGVHLRDLIEPPVWFCFTHDDLDTARATLGAASADAIAVVDAHRRVVGVLTEPLLGGRGSGRHARPAMDAADRSGESHPNLQVYAPWAVVET